MAELTKARNQRDHLTGSPRRELNKYRERRLGTGRGEVTTRAKRLDRDMKIVSATSRGPVRTRVSWKRSATFNLSPLRTAEKDKAPGDPL